VYYKYVFNFKLEGVVLMKKILFIMLAHSSFTVIACDDEEIQSVGWPTTVTSKSQTNGNQMENSSSGSLGTEICLPPIKAVITFIPMDNWLSGAYGIAYALSYSQVGGGTVVANVSFSTLTGCSTTTEAERVASAQKIFGDMGHKMQEQFIAYGPDSPQGRHAERWLDQHGVGGTFILEFPDQSRGYYNIGEGFILTENTCGTPNP